MAVAALVWAWGNQTPATGATGTTVEANRLILRDSKGIQRGIWEVSDRDEAYLQIARPKVIGINLAVSVLVFPPPFKRAGRR